MILDIQDKEANSCVVFSDFKAANKLEPDYYKL